MKCKKERMRTRALLHSFPSSLALRLCRRNLSVLSIIYGRTCSARLFLAFSEGRILTAARPRERPFTATAAAAAAAGKKGKRDRADGSRGGIDRPSVRPSVRLWGRNARQLRTHRTPRRKGNPRCCRVRRREADRGPQGEHLRMAASANQPVSAWA